MTTFYSIRIKTKQNLFFILQLICSACSFPEIKSQTGLSFQTASNHFRNLKNKIQKIIQNIFIHLSFFIISTKHPKFIFKSNTTSISGIYLILNREINLFIKVTYMKINIFNLKFNFLTIKSDNHRLETTI